MLDEAKARCDLLAANSEAVRKKFFLEKDLMSIVSGLIFTSAGKEADTARMKECRKILKRRTRLLSNLRAVVELALLSKMALAEDPQKYFSDFMTVYKTVRKGKLLENDYMVLASLLILDLDCQEESTEIVTKAKALFQKMNADHPVLTTSEDTSFVMLLALTDKTVPAVMEDLQEGYAYLKNTCKFSATGNAIYELCEVLAISYGNMTEKCDRAMRVFGAFKKRKSEYGTSTELSSLGALIDLQLDTDSLVDEIIEAEAYLKTKSGFGDKIMEKKQRLMYAAIVVAGVCGRDTSVIGNAVITNTLSIIKAKQVATMISIIGNVAPAVLTSLIDEEEEEKDSESADKDKITDESSEDDGK